MQGATAVERLTIIIDRMVCEDGQRGRRNLSMAWIDVAKAYDSVDHGWLPEMFTLHRFPIWFAKVMEKLANLCRKWESNPRPLDYISGVLTTAPLRQPCWQQSNRCSQWLTTGFPGGF